jgi:hypothetical protein
MNLQEQIVALLLEQFPGTRKDGLTQLAAAICLQVETEDQAKEIVGKLTADKVSKFVNDWRSAADAENAKAVKTREDALKAKYNFVEKQQQQQQQQQQNQDGGAITLDAIKQLIQEQMKGVQDSITSITAANTAADRRKLYVAELDNAKIQGKTRDMLLKNFDRVNNFGSEDDFATFLTDAKEDIAALAQETVNTTLQQQKPLFGAVNKEGVSSGVADYIAAQQATEKPLTGKEV